MLEPLSQMNLQVSASYFGEVTYPAGGTLGPRQQKELQFVIIHSGECEITVSGRSRWLPNQHVALLWPGHAEFFRFSRTAPTRHSWCAFKVTLPAVELSALEEQLPFCQPLSARFETLLGLGLSLRDDQRPETTTLRDGLAACLFWAFRGDAGSEGGRGGVLPPTVRRAQGFVEAHYTEPLELSEIARASFVSPAHLIRLFRRHLGTTPTRYLWRVRLQHGVALLRDTGLPVSEIAYRVGFKTPAHFSRVVKRTYQRSPQEIRRRHWE